MKKFSQLLVVVLVVVGFFGFGCGKKHNEGITQSEVEESGKEVKQNFSQSLPQKSSSFAGSATPTRAEFKYSPLNEPGNTFTYELNIDGRNVNGEVQFRVGTYKYIVKVFDNFDNLIYVTDETTVTVVAWQNPNLTTAFHENEPAIKNGKLSLTVVMDSTLTGYGSFWGNYPGGYISGGLSFSNSTTAGPKNFFVPEGTHSLSFWCYDDNGHTVADTTFSVTIVASQTTTQTLNVVSNWATGNFDGNLAHKKK